MWVDDDKIGGWMNYSVLTLSSRGTIQLRDSDTP